MKPSSVVLNDRPREGQRQLRSDCKQMRITSIQTFVMGVPGRNGVFIKIGADEGVHGWGQATMEWQEGAVVEGIKRVSPSCWAGTLSASSASGKPFFGTAGGGRVFP
jgi:hypothetical protein